VTSQKNGVSALGLQRVLGFASYETAWAWTHKLRRAMVRPDRERLSGIVEVDETMVGGVSPGMFGGSSGKVAVMVAVERNGVRRLGRVRLGVAGRPGSLDLVDGPRPWSNPDPRSAPTGPGWWKWKDIRRGFTTPDGRWRPLTADGIALFDLSSVPVTRYRYRGNHIPTPGPCATTPQRHRPWRARCGESRTPGSASDLGKRTESNLGTAPQADSTLPDPIHRFQALLRFHGSR